MSSTTIDAAPPSLVQAGAGHLAPALRQLALVALIIAAAAALSLAHLRLPSRLFYILAALAASAHAKRRSPWLYITCTIWFWTLTPFARRLIDYGGGFDPQNIILALPNLLCLLMLPDVVRSKTLIRLPEFATGMLLVVPMIWGLSVNFAQGDIVPALAGAADWFPPLLYYFYFLTLAPRIGEADAPMRVFLTLNMLVLVGYGLYQYFAPPIWDVRWVLDSELQTAGIPVPFGLRIFSTLNAPALCAIWFGSLLLLSLHFRTRLTIILLPAAVLALFVTFIRSMLGCVLAGLLVAGLLGGARVLKPLLLMVAASVMMVGILTLIDPTVSEKIVARLSTVGELGQDESAIERAWLYQAAPGILNKYPFGLGLAAVGRGAVVSEGIASLDSGPIAILLTMGWVGGSIYMAGILAILAQSLMAARRSASPAALAMASVVACGVVQLIFCYMISFYAATVWLCAGYASAVGIQAAGRMGRR